MKKLFPFFIISNLLITQPMVGETKTFLNGTSQKIDLILYTENNQKEISIESQKKSEIELEDFSTLSKIVISLNYKNSAQCFPSVYWAEIIKSNKNNRFLIKFEGNQLIILPFINVS